MVSCHAQDHCSYHDDEHASLSDEGDVVADGGLGEGQGEVLPAHVRVAVGKAVLHPEPRNTRNIRTRSILHAFILYWQEQS